MKHLLRLCTVVLLLACFGACSKEQSQTVFLNKQNLTLLPNATPVHRFANNLGDTLFFYRANLDTSFTALPLAGSNYQRFVEGRNAVFLDSTGRYRADFGLYLTAHGGSNLYDVTHVLEHRFADSGQSTDLEVYFELAPPELRVGAFFSQLIWVNDTLENVFVTGQPGPGMPLLLYTTTSGFVGFQNVDNQQFYRL